MATKMNPGFMAMIKKKAGDKPAKKMAAGGMPENSINTTRGGKMAQLVKAALNNPSRGKVAAGGMHKMPDGKMMKDSAMKSGGKVKKMASGGRAAGHKSADGIASKGKTKAKQIVMKSGGKVC
jgi:hypothetical protein